MVAITGRTRLIAVLGDPVTQVQAPAMLNPVLADLGRDAVVVPVQVPSGELPAVGPALMRIANLDGLLVTVPHKRAAVDLADAVSPAVEACGSTNALRRNADGSWYAENFDGAGFVNGLLAAGRPVAGSRAAVVGAGGAGAAIGAALLLAGVARLVLLDTDPAVRDTLAARLLARWPGRVGTSRRELGTADLVVNATPLGMRAGDPLPFDPAMARADTVVADIVMQPAETALLRAAAAAGRRVQPGAPMLRHQIPLYRAFFWP